jgi:hypothetical protein
MLFIVHLWQFTWTDRNPFPSLATVGGRMGVTRRQVRNYVHSLREKGHLRVTERTEPGRGQITSEYDFSPLIAATIDLERVDDPPPGNTSSEGCLSHPRNDFTEGAGKDPSSEEDTIQEDSAIASSCARAIRQEPSKGVADAAVSAVSTKCRVAARGGADVATPDGPAAPFRTPSQAGRQGGIRELAARHRAVGPRRKTDYLDSVVAGLTVELGDDAHLQANLVQARNLLMAAGVEEEVIVGLVFRARSLLRDRERRPGPWLHRRGAYFFAILRDLLRAGPGSASRGAEAPSVPAEDTAEGGHSPAWRSDEGQQSFRRKFPHSREAGTPLRMRSSNTAFESLSSILQRSPSTTEK